MSAGYTVHEHKDEKINKNFEDESDYGGDFDYDGDYDFYDGDFILEAKKRTKENRLKSLHSAIIKSNKKHNTNITIRGVFKKRTGRKPANRW